MGMFQREIAFSLVLMRSIVLELHYQSRRKKTLAVSLAEVWLFTIFTVSFLTIMGCDLQHWFH